MNRSEVVPNRIIPAIGVGTILLWVVYKFTVPPLIRGTHDGSISTPWGDQYIRMASSHSLDSLLHYGDRFALAFLAGVFLMICTYYVFRFFRDDSWPGQLQQWLQEHTASIDALPEARIGWWIALASGLGIFAELLIIRLHGSCFEVFAYYKNLSLLSCFLGLGIGYARGMSGLLTTPLAVPLLAFQVVLLALLRWAGVGLVLENPVSEQVGFGVGQATSVLQSGLVLMFFLAVFSFNALCFIPLGHLASRLMARKTNLPSYSWNLFGSLLAIVLFSLLSMVWSPPTVWICCAVVATFPFLRERKMLAASAAAMAIVVLVITLLPRTSLVEIYSPYQVLNLSQETFSDSDGASYFNLQVNNTYYQRILGLGQKEAKRIGMLEAWRRQYDFPYALRATPADVLVVGSGTGNDVAAAVRNGASHTDAVEIDPAILKFGRDLHPERPYASHRVDAVVNDARAFLRHTDRKYDLIVYGLLDSHTLLSGRGGVRLDSFVYTVEGLREADMQLKDGGLLCLSFCLIKPELGRKLLLMLEEATGRAPLVFCDRKGG